MIATEPIYDYGKAAKYDFDNPEKWFTVEDVPLLDEHEMTDENGNPVAYVGRKELEEIANNNNRKIRETGDPPTLILGHNSDDPKVPEKPAQGFCVKHKVKPYNRDENGQIIYAIHGSYKLRHNKAHLIEEYPRRSVELWWHKKDIDPIAMLGGSTPERPLGLVLRKSRDAILMNHVSMYVDDVVASNSSRRKGDTSSSREGVILFSHHGKYDIETYYINDMNKTNRYSKRRESSKPSKVEKVMHEYKEGELRSGSKKGPKVTSKKQAIAIGMSEAGMSKNGKGKSKYSMNAHIPAERKPNKYSGLEQEAPVPSKTPFKPKKAPQHQEIEEMHEGPEEMDEMDHGEGYPVNLDDAGYGEGPERYDALDQDFEDHGEYDGGEEAVPGEEGDDQDENDPILAKVFQSKQWNELSSGIGQIKQMLSGLMGGGEEEQGGMPGEEGMGGEEMPQPGSGMQQAPSQNSSSLQGGGRGVGGEDGMEPPMEDESSMGEEQEPEEDERAMHGQKPVKMNAGMSTGMPGPSNTYISGFTPTARQVGKKHPSKMSRSSEPMNRASQNRSPIADLQARLARSERREKEMRLQLSRMKAQADIQQLESEGVLFGPNPEVADKIKYARQEELTLAYLHDEDSVDETGEPDTYVKDKIEEMRVCYSRRRADPARRPNMQNQASLARYSRTEADIAGVPLPESNDDDFEDKLGQSGSFEAISEFADLQSVKKMSRQDAVKYCRKKYGIR